MTTTRIGTITRIGQLRVREVAGWGPVGDGCRKGRHRWRRWVPSVNDGRPDWTRWCDQCGWVSIVVPVVDGPHRLVRRVGGEWCRSIGLCGCGKVWNDKRGRCVGTIDA